MNSDNSKEKVTVFNAFIEPVLRYIVGVAEVIALSVFFHVAADKTDSLLLDAFSFLLVCTVGAYIGLPVGMLATHLDKIKTRDWRVAFGIALPLGIVGAVLAHIVGREISQAVTELAKLGIS